MRIRVYLPDGRDFEVVGAWKGVMAVVASWGGPGSTASMNVPTVRITKAFRLPGSRFVKSGEHFAGNPLAVFKNVSTGEVLYDPRASERYEALLPNEQRWIDEHPAWPGELVS